MLIMRILFGGRFHHYISIMHIQRSLICSSTRHIIIPLVTLIHISSQPSCHEIHVLPNRTIYVTINQPKALNPNSCKVTKLHADPAIIHMDIESIPMSRFSTQ